MKSFYLEDFKERLDRYPTIPWREEDSCIWIDPKSDSNFSVAVYIDEWRALTRCEGWNEPFDDLDDLVQRFLFVLSPKARLKVESKGGRDFRWTLQSRPGRHWKTESRTSSLFYPYWKETKVRYLQNTFEAPFGSHR